MSSKPSKPNQPVSVALADLRQYLGRRVVSDGVECEIVEVLEDGPALILQEASSHLAIQPDQHGEAHRHAPITRMVPVLNPERTDYAAAFLHLGL